MVSGLSEIPQGGVVACPINNISYLKKFRKELRNKLTPAEAKLWTNLQNSTLDGRKFRRPHSVANFILDFYCPAESLAIELDGEIHYNPTRAEYNRERDVFLNAKGIKVIRFDNKIVFQNPHGLLQAIKNNFGWKNATLSEIVCCTGNAGITTPSAIGGEPILSRLTRKNHPSAVGGEPILSRLTRNHHPVRR